VRAAAARVGPAPASIAAPRIATPIAPSAIGFSNASTAVTSAIAYAAATGARAACSGLARRT